MARKRKTKSDDPPAVAESAVPVSSPFVQTRPQAVVKLVFALALVFGVVGGLIWFGGELGQRLVGRDRYEMRVADIVCDAPPGSERLPFLTEVRYISGLPETVSAIDAKLPDQLTAAFGKHPWVADVSDVRIDPDRRIHVSLRFRLPVMAIPIEGRAEWRVVDDRGVLLPTTTPTDGLAEYAEPLPAPTFPAGEMWPSDDVKFAADLCKQYSLRKIEKTPKGWRLTQRDGKVLIVGV